MPNSTRDRRAPAEARRASGAARAGSQQADAGLPADGLRRLFDGFVDVDPGEVMPASAFDPRWEG